MIRHGQASSRIGTRPLPGMAPAGPGRYAPEPEIRGHSGYAADPAMWETLAALADELRERR